MKVLKRRFLRIVFSLELLMFAGIYMMGPHGRQALQKIEQENMRLGDDIALLQHDVHELEFSIAQWHESSFYKEKIAREQLQMARAGDQIYYIS